MIHIDQLTLNLPHGFADRANSIARLTGEYLSGCPERSSPLTLDTLTVNCCIDPTLSDRYIAQTLARSVQDKISSL